MKIVFAWGWVNYKWIFIFERTIALVCLGLNIKWVTMNVSTVNVMYLFGCSSCAAQGREASEGEHPAVHQLHPWRADGTHQQRLLWSARLVLQGAGGHEQEPPQWWQQGKTWRSKENINRILIRIETFIAFSPCQLTVWSQFFGLCCPAHGKDLHACVPSGEDAELLREGGVSEFRGTAAALRCLQPLRVCAESPNPDERGQSSLDQNSRKNVF